MLAPWAREEEMEKADLEDKRLNERLAELLSALGERPTASIPGRLWRVQRDDSCLSLFRQQQGPM